MSIFYNDPPAPEKKKEDVPIEFALMAGALAIGAVAYAKWHLIMRFYFRNFETIWLSAYGAIALIAAVIIGVIVKRTKALTDRENLLGEVSDSFGSIFVGTTHDGENLYLSEKDRCGHPQIMGSTGRGKTVSVVESWACRDILALRNVILMDGKGDPGILKNIRRAAKKSIRRPDVFVFDLGNPKESCATNPLEFGSAQQITDRIFTAFSFEDPYYRAVQYDVTGNIIELIKEIPGNTSEGEKPKAGVVTFRRIYECLTDDMALSQAIAESHNEVLRTKLTRFLATPKGLREEKFSGLTSQLAPFAVGEVAPLVNGPSEERPNAVSVSRILLPSRHEEENRYQYVFVVLIPTLKYQQIGHQLGKLILQEIGWAVGERASTKGELATFTPLFLDEFSAFVYEGFANILNKARSSRVALHLSHQSQADLSLVSREFAQVITTNTNVKCILGLNDPESADFMARHMGTETEEKTTEQAREWGLFPKREKTGAMSVREVEAYKIHPNLLKNYTNGRGVLHLPTRLGNVTEEIQFARLSREELNEKGVEA